MAGWFVRSNWLLILVVLLVSGCSAAAPAAPTSVALTRSCPSALGPISAPIVAAAANTLVTVNADGSGQIWLLSLVFIFHLNHPDRIVERELLIQLGMYP